MRRFVTLAESEALPFWRRPVPLLFVMAAAMPIAFYAWYALLNNFVVEAAGFDGADIGLLHTVREIPGFLAVGVIAIIVLVREQVLGLVSLAAILYVIDHILFGLALALKTYFQKIADPGDIAPTAAAALTINHIAAVFLPVLLGLMWVVSPAAVFGLAAGIALVSLLLALLVPRHPEPGNETRLSRFAAAPAE